MTIVAQKARQSLKYKNCRNEDLKIWVFDKLVLGLIPRNLQ